MNDNADDWTGRFTHMAQEADEVAALRAETATLRAALLEAAADVDARAAENERWRAAWAKWRPGIESTRNFYEKDGNEGRARAYAAMLRDFDAACPT